MALQPPEDRYDRGRGSRTPSAYPDPRVDPSAGDDRGRESGGGRSAYPETGATIAEAESEGVLGLSLTGIVGGALAAVSAAALGARLGLAGTLTGAAIGSIVSAIAAAAYTRSLRRGRQLLRTLPVAGPQAANTPAGRLPRQARTLGHTGFSPRRIAAFAAVLFASVAIIVTGIELGLGRSFDGGGSTTVGEVVKRAGTGATSPSSSPTGQTPASTSSSDPAGESSSSSTSESSSSESGTSEPGTGTPTGTESPASTDTSTGSSSPTSTDSGTGTATEPPGQDSATPQASTVTAPDSGAGASD